MSDDEGRDFKSEKSNGNDNNNICRDFLRNVCRRGALCKYKHPDGGLMGENSMSSSKQMDLHFCHDYQNRECTRPNCKFLHCSRQEEQEFHATGDLPKHVAQMHHKGNDTHQSGHGMGKGDVPICKDYLKGDCRRAGRCKFRHVTAQQLDLEEMNAELKQRRLRYNVFENMEPEPKRRAFDEPYMGGPHLILGTNGGPLPGGETMLPLQPPQTFDFRIMEEENILLRRKIEEMKKQILDLTSTNEFLLNQNAQLRISKQTAIGQSLNPMAAMTMSNELTASRMASELAGSMGVPVTLGQMAPVSMAPGSMGQGMAPVSMAPVSMGQGMAPVSMATVSMCPIMPSVSLAQSMMTMSTPSTNLVNYPIMTQSSMRPVIPHSMGH